MRYENFVHLSSWEWKGFRTTLRIGLHYFPADSGTSVEIINFPYFVLVLRHRLIEETGNSGRHLSTWPMGIAYVPTLFSLSRKEEIESLQEALKILNGEDIA